MMRLLRRARRVTAEELHWRLRELAYTTTDRLRARLREPRWDPRDIEHVLAPSVLDAPMRRSIASGNWAEVDRQIEDRLKQRPSRFVIDPANAEAVRAAVLVHSPDAARDAAARADRIIDGHYDVLGYRGLTFTEQSGAIDWHFDPVHHKRPPNVCWADVPYLDPACGDHKIIWELNRHQQWLALGRGAWLTGDARYADAIVGQFESWLAANPPLTGMNWASMLEIALRTISWTAAWSFLAGIRDQGSGIREVGADLKVGANVGAGLKAGPYLIALHHQLTHVERHLSYYFSPNTHLTGEALALYVVGSAFPELAASARWISTGRRVLLQEIERQVLPDGGHVERSTHYQRYTLDFYLLASLTAKRTGDADAERSFRAAVDRLATFTRAIADDNGCLPLIGDDDGGMLWPLTGRECNDVRDSLAVAAIVLDRPDLAPWGVPEEAYWVAGLDARKFLTPDPRSLIPDPGSRTPGSRTFSDTGYVVLRGRGEHAVFDAGLHGYMNGGHAHADALSLNLTCGERPLLVDPGTSTYTTDATVRDRMRSSFNHNTISIDGRSQSVPSGPFHWQTVAQARIHTSRHNAAFDLVEGVHDGYAPLEHRRAIVRATGAGWLVVDAVGGMGLINPKFQIPNPKSHNFPNPKSHNCRSQVEHRHCSVAAHWHFHPNWMVRADEGGRLRATHVDGGDAWLLCDGGDIALQHGNDESGLGWFAPVYGTLIPTWTAQITRSQALPVVTVTWIGCGPAAHDPALERLDVAGDAAAGAVAARVVDGNRTSTYLIHVGAADSSDRRTGATAGYQTDARFLHLRTDANQFVALDLADARHAVARSDGAISVTASETVVDLHVGFERDTLVLEASAPPQQLRVEGPLLQHARAITLNGRALVTTDGDGADAIVIAGDEWAGQRLDGTGKPFALDSVPPRGCEEFLPLRESSW